MFIVMTISLLSPCWCLFPKEIIACVSRSLLFWLLLGYTGFKMVLSSVPHSFALLSSSGFDVNWFLFDRNGKCVEGTTFLPPPLCDEMVRKPPAA